MLGFWGFYLVALGIFVISYALCYAVMFGVEIFDFLTQYRYMDAVFGPICLVAGIIALPIAALMKKFGVTFAVWLILHGGGG